MRRSLALALLALGGAACSLAISVDGLTGGGADAGAAAVDASVALDGAASDAPIADRAAPDAAPGPDADAAPASLCAGAHVFCTDFEEDDPRSKWDGTSTSALCAVRSGVFECATTPGQSDPVLWHRGLSFPKGVGFRVDLDVAITAPVGSGFEMDPFTIDTSGGPGVSAFLALPVYGSQVIWEYNKKLADGGFEYPGVALPLDRTGGWHHLTMTFRAAGVGQAATSSIAVDGTLVGSHVIDLPGAMPSTTIRIGLVYLSAAPAASFRIDNLVVDEL